MTPDQIKIHHLAHDLGEAKGEINRLKAQIRSLASDARDALEIDLPAPMTALRRIKSILEVVKASP